MFMQDESYNAQVSAVFDTDGKIHPRWCKFRNSMGEVIIIEKLTVEKENSEDNKIHRNFWCSAYMYCRRQEFCLSYIIRNHSWTVEYRTTERGYRFLLSHDQSEFS